MLKTIPKFVALIYASHLLAYHHQCRAESRTELCEWVCEQHNLVNKKLGKKIKDKDERKAAKQKLIENVKEVPKRKKEQPLNKKKSRAH